MMAERPPLPYDYLPKVPSFTVTSDDMADGQKLSEAQVYNGFGVSGGNSSPHLRWEGAPAETQSYVVTCYDPDAPTGSGFWHWVTWDIPATTTSLPTGAVLPPGSVSGENDSGTLGYTGPCPPAGDKVHDYEITVVALSVPTLGLDPTTHPAVVGFSIGQNALAAETLVATAQQ
jgi:Raf kinase inhibitor-like YbhB/YbcL family protein